MSWFVRLQLSDYEVMFHESLEGAWLDKVDRRYAWLRRTLVTMRRSASPSSQLSGQYQRGSPYSSATQQGLCVHVYGMEGEKEKEREREREERREREREREERKERERGRWAGNLYVCVCEKCS